MRDHRHRTTRSPPRPRFRDREVEENRGHCLKRCLVELERPRAVDGRLHGVNDDDKDDYARKLSRFNETLPRRELTSTKFHWANLLADKPEKWDTVKILSGNDTVGLSKSKRRQSLCSTVSKTRDYDGVINGVVFPSGRFCLDVKEHVEGRLYNEEEKLGLFPCIRTAFESRANVTTTTAAVSGLNDDYNVTYKEGGFNRRRELLAESVGRDGYCGLTPVSKPSAISQSGSYISSMESRDRNYLHVEEQMSEYDRVYRSMASVGDKYTLQNSVRTSIVDSIVDKLDGSYSSMRDDIRGSRELEHNRGLHDQYLHIGKESLVTERDGEYSGSRISHVTRGPQSIEEEGENSGSRSSFHYECGSEVNLNGGSLEVGENCGPQRDGGLESNEEDLKRLQMSNHDILYENEDRSQEMLALVELGVENQSEKVLKPGRVVDLTKITQNTEHKLSLDWDSSDDIHDTRYVELVKHSSIDIKKRLEWPPRNMKKRLGPAKIRNKRVRQLRKPIKTSSQVINKQLMAIPNDPFALSRSKNDKQSKFHKRNLNDSHEGAYVEGDDYLEVKMKSLKTEPLEHTEYFEQLVHSAFMRFVKVLNESTAQQRKFTERGGKRTLKCSVCCRNSKEFVDTLSLVQHAFTSQTVELRAEHLGFHRALCVLMGWNYAAKPNGLWILRVLPYAEASALKQDLIIWPPVVFVHNCSIANTNPDERIIVNTEELGSFIKGMGFGGITKVCRGKAANQSTLVVNFHSTLSGLQEAERLHKLYAENKHGREEFEQITFQSNSNRYKISNADKFESVLYGYLGISEDLDKVDFEAKRRCFVRSKKEIQAIAGASFGRE